MSYQRPAAFEPDSSPPSEQLQFVVHAGPLAGKGFPLSSDTITFGRDPDNDIFWDDTQVSRHHAQLMRRGDELVLEDLGSTNGSFVNEVQVKRQRLKHGDIIRIGWINFKFHDQSKEEGVLEKTSKIKKSWIPGVFYSK